ncbi:VOC family protein [Micromonospora sp. WMMD712]|uniref:VOC family protein n=1 Tax=Micromonospora sp. WMMD712 TaxID=3016096 RepID=UPI00249AF39E|nr:VOC family protein [Micromonospora sp. WMMD712]WFE60209.1 VOC family protein [Micromonospora sp. WMMD712]
MISHIRQVSLGVPDLTRARDFYEHQWQLDLVGVDDDRVYLGAGCAESYSLRLRSTSEPRVDLLALAVTTPADVDAIAERVARRSDARLVGLPGPRQEPGGGYAVRFHDCDGRTLEVSAGVDQRAYEPLAATDTRPVGISHVVLNTVDIQRSRRFYEDVLGFKVSDWVEDYFCFLRTGPAHHLIAFTSAPHASLNHVAFEVLGIDEFMRATGRMMRNGHPLIWGPGRHGVGDNTFSYFSDPSSGFVMEYTTALQLVDESTWEPQVHASTDQGIDQWGTSNPLDDAVRSSMRGRPDPGLWTPPPV